VADEIFGAWDQESLNAFWNKYSAYPGLPTKPPEVLNDLAGSVAGWLATNHIESGNAFLDQRMQDGMNLYRRFADVDMYQSAIERALDLPDKLVAASGVGSLLVGYFSAAASLTDAAAIALDRRFKLGLSANARDLSDSRFWERFASRELAACNRYQQFQALGVEVGDWRLTAVHRSTPLVVAHGKEPGDPEMKVRLFNKHDAIFSDLFSGSTDESNWIDPMAYPSKWRANFIEMYCQLTSDHGHAP
jgi:hypothetical protein